MTQKIYKDDFERIYHEWDDALSKNDMESLLALYSDNTIVESPLIPHLTGSKNGICTGKEEFRKVLEMVAAQKPPLRKYYKNNYFTDGKTLIFEYPRLAPNGEQMDFMEVMDIEDGLITYHRIYWGWRGFKVLKDDAYHQK